MNRGLIGKPGGRRLLDTPVLVVDLDALEHNIAAMAQFGRAAKLALRPHAKTHKSAHIGALQMQAGAVGLSCAKLSEAEALAAQGLGPLLITSPIVGAGASQRLAALCGRSADLGVVVDCVAQVNALAGALAGRALNVFVDVDPGAHRTGVASEEQALQVARAIQQHGNLTFAGLQFFSGPSQHIESLVARTRDVEHRTAYLASIATALREAGMAPKIITGGGTGTHELDAKLGVMTELQVGSYVFMDDQYVDCELGEHTKPFLTSLCIDTRVISANWPGRATLDAGVKASTGSAKPPRIIGGAADGALYQYHGDEHGTVIMPSGVDAPALGEIVSLRTPHCDPTVNLYDFFHVVRGEELVDIWPVTARGCSY